jgi:hypothetical protein
MKYYSMSLIGPFKLLKLELHEQLKKCYGLSASTDTHMMDHGIHFGKTMLHYRAIFLHRSNCNI